MRVFLICLLLITFSSELLAKKCIDKGAHKIIKEVFSCAKDGFVEEMSSAFADKITKICSNEDMDNPCGSYRYSKTKCYKKFATEIFFYYKDIKKYLLDKYPTCQIKPEIMKKYNSDLDLTKLENQDNDPDCYYVEAFYNYEMYPFKVKLNKEKIENCSGLKVLKYCNSKMRCNKSIGGFIAGELYDVYCSGICGSKSAIDCHYDNSVKEKAAEAGEAGYLLYTEEKESIKIETK